MDDDYTDDDGTILIWKLMAPPTYPADESRHLPTEVRHRLAEHRLAQISWEAARNIEALQQAATRRLMRCGATVEGNGSG